MSLPPEQQDESYKSILIYSVKSPGFWSLVLGATGIAAIVIGGGINLAFSALSDLSLWVLLAGSLLVFLALILSPRSIAIFLVGRKGRYGTNVAIMTIAFFIILLIVNFLMYRSPNRIDVTATRVFSLSEQTLQILDGLENEVVANAFFVEYQGSSSARQQRQQAEDLLNEFSRRSALFSYRFIDPELNRAQALKYNVKVYPAVVFEDKNSGRQQGVSTFTEQEFVTGVLVSTDVQQKDVRFLTGHGEAEFTKDLMLQSVEDDGLDYAIEGMQRDNYRVLPLNLKQASKVPEDTAVLVIAGPTNNLDKDEFEAIAEFIAGGGNIIAMFDPGLPDGFNALIAPYGVVIGDKMVADAVSNVAGEMLTPMLQRANGQYATSNQTGIGIADKIGVTFFPEAGSIDSIINPADMPPHIKFNAIGFTTPASWLETNPENPGFSEEEFPGPFVISGLLEASGQIHEPTSLVADRVPAKVVIFSDSDFATNKYFHSSDNSDLFLNSVNWLAEDYELISIRPKLVPYRELVVNARERDFIKWSSWVFPPSLMLILGVIVWWRRR